LTRVANSQGRKKADEFGKVVNEVTGYDIIEKLRKEVEARGELSNLEP
jgi:hypothetical protein